MWRDGEGKPEARSQQPVLGPKLQPSGNTRPQNGAPEGNQADSSGLRDDRCALQQRHHHIGRRQTAHAAALEKHPPLERA